MPVNAVPEKREQETDEYDKYRHSAAVAKIGSFVGLNADQASTAFTVLNFLVLAAGVAYLALKTLPKAFQQRSSTIQKGLVDARTATEEANARLRAVEARLSKLDEEIAGMKHQAEADTLREEQRIKASVEAEAAKIVAAAESEIQSATSLARRELQRHAAELAIAQAARQLEISAETDRLLVQSFALKLTGGKGAEN
jgi:F-type H+-transporting ATPase subunit b